MDINKKTIEFASYIRNTPEFKNLQKYRSDLDKNKNLKKQLDNYQSKKNNIYSRYDAKNAYKMLLILDKDYVEFFKNPIISKYVLASNEFNNMIESIYKLIEKELLKK